MKQTGQTAIGFEAPPQGHPGVDTLVLAARSENADEVPDQFFASVAVNGDERGVFLVTSYADGEFAMREEDLEAIGIGRSGGDIVMTRTQFRAFALVQAIQADFRRAGLQLADHAAHLIIHGLLHLAGHDHVHSDEEAEAMEAAKEELAVADDCEPEVQREEESRANTVEAWQATAMVCTLLNSCDKLGVPESAVHLERFMRALRTATATKPIKKTFFRPNTILQAAFGKGWF